MTSDEALRSIAQRRVADRRGFQLDLLMYVVINAIIWVAWFTLLAPDGGFPWPLFVSGGWGIGLAAHGLLTYWTLSGADDAAVERELERMRSSRARSSGARDDA